MVRMTNTIKAVWILGATRLRLWLDVLLFGIGLGLRFLLLFMISFFWTYENINDRMSHIYSRSSHQLLIQDSGVDEPLKIEDNSPYMGGEQNYAGREDN